MIRRIGLACAFAMFGCAATGPLCLYGWGLAQIPEERRPAHVPSMPEPAIRAFWASFSRDEHPIVLPTDPYRRIWELVQAMHRGGASDGSRLAALTARTVLLRDLPPMRPIRWTVVWSAGEIWVRRHWSADEATSAYLAAVDFGHGFWGLEPAAQGYFHTPVVELNALQLAHLMVLTQAPTIYDPWCSPDQAGARARLVLERLGVADDALPLKLVPPSPGACS